MVKKWESSHWALLTDRSVLKPQVCVEMTLEWCLSLLMVKNKTIPMLMGFRPAGAPARSSIWYSNHYVRIKFDGQKKTDHRIGVTLFGTVHQPIEDWQPRWHWLHAYHFLAHLKKMRIAGNDVTGILGILPDIQYQPTTLCLSESIFTQKRLSPSLVGEVLMIILTSFPTELNGDTMMFTISFDGKRGCR